MLILLDSVAYAVLRSGVRRDDVKTGKMTFYWTINLSDSLIVIYCNYFFPTA